ncbi:MAG: extracellular solute-binding protein [Actinobacteria bacterium]|nr:extracellular solute-binding protein [Actinomycetota bacterium]
MGDRRLDRREFLRLAAAGAVCAAAGAGCSSGSGNAATKTSGASNGSATPKQLRIAQAAHFVPAYDVWFDNEYTRAWGEKHDVQATPLCERSAFNPKTSKWFCLPDYWAPAPVNYRTDYWAGLGKGGRPDSWADLLAAGPKLKAAGHPLGVDMSFDLDGNMNLIALLFAYGATLQTEDGQPAMNRLVVGYRTLSSGASSTTFRVFPMRSPTSPTSWPTHPEPNRRGSMAPEGENGKRPRRQGRPGRAGASGRCGSSSSATSFLPTTPGSITSTSRVGATNMTSPSSSTASRSTR